MKSKCSFVLNIQLAKLAGNKVVATCGGESKSTFLTSLGVDRVINYRSEKIKDVSFCSSLSYLFFILQLFIMQSLLFIFQMFNLTFLLVPFCADISVLFIDILVHIYVVWLCSNLPGSRVKS